MSRDGWIKVHRKILDNPIVCKDGDHVAIWVYLLVNATHQEQPALFKGEKITLKPGQLITGRKAISQKLTINESKVRRVLTSFENDQQIDRKISNQNSLISILNWVEYQTDDQQIDQRVTNERPTSDQRVTTNKNEKNVKNERMKRNNISALIEEYTDDPELSSAISDFVEMRKQIKAPITDRGLKAIFKKLDGMESTDKGKVAVLEQSIERSWRGVFPLKDEERKKAAREYNIEY